MKKLNVLESKIDILAVNQDRFNRHVLPGEKIVKRPPGLSGFPVQSVEEAKKMERFLRDDSNKAAIVSVTLSSY